MVTQLIDKLPSILTALAAVVGAIAAIRGLRQGQANGAKADDAAAIVKTNDAKTDTLIEKAEAIHTNTDQIYTNTNGNLDRLRADLKLANDKIAQLHDLVERLLADKEKAPRSGRIGDPKP